MSHPIRVVQFGLGPIGIESLRTVLAKQATGLIRLVGAIDIDPEKSGRDVADLVGLPEPTGIVVASDAARLFAEVQADVVIHTTASFLDRVHDQLRCCVEAGLHVVSSTEELSFPFERHPGLAAELDQLAREHGVVVLGTGVNPGYAMDTLALMATGVCTDVASVHIERIVDAGQRRQPLQRKVGAGLTLDAFEAQRATGTFGHIGLRESLLLVANGLGWQLDRIEEALSPVVASETVVTPYLTVEPGRVAGIHHTVDGYVDGRAVLSLDLQMYVGADAPRDAVHVAGTPPIDLVIRGGIFGDTATVAILVNMVPLVVAGPPGLRTMQDLPVPRAFASALVQRHGGTGA